MRLQLDARARRLVRRLPRTSVYSALELVLLGVLAVQCARLAWTIVTPVGPIGDWRPAAAGYPGSASQILHDFDPFFRSSGGDQPAAVTPLQLTLFGTRLDSATGKGSAIIAGPDNLQQSFSVGDEVAPGAHLKEVAFDHVVIDRGGASENLFIDQSDAVAATQPAAEDADASVPDGAPPPPSSPAAERDSVTFAQLRSDIGYIPRIEGGKVTGLAVRPTGTGETFNRAGLRDADVITAIGGRPITGPNDLERIAGQYGNGGTLDVTVARDGAAVPVTITIAGK